MKLKDMTDRQLLLFTVAEVRCIKKKLDNHLHHCWQIVIALVAIAGTAIASLLVALLTK